jgi:hypothetical protein
MDELLSLVTPKFRGWNWIRLDDGRKVHSVKILNENGQSKISFDGEFSEAEVRAAAMRILRQEKDRRQQAAKRASDTRAARRNQDVYLAASLYMRGRLSPSNMCFICHRAITDPSSAQRGIGSECWQEVLRVAEQLQIKKESTK